MSQMPILLEKLGAKFEYVGRIGSHERVRKIVLPNGEVVRFECLVNGCKSIAEERLLERRCEKFVNVGW